MEENNQTSTTEQYIPAPAGLDTKNVKAPKKDTRIKTDDVIGTKNMSFADFGLS